MDAGERDLVRQGVAVDRETIRPIWQATLDRVLREAMLARPADRWMQTAAARAGTASTSATFAEMQVLHRAHPGATW